MRTKKINGSRRFTEIKVKKTCSVVYTSKLNFGKISREDLLCTYESVKRMDIENLITRAL